MSISEHEHVTWKETDITTAQQKLLRDMHEILVSQQSSDVTIIVNGVTRFQAHSAFLAIRCPELFYLGRTSEVISKKKKKSEKSQPQSENLVIHLNNIDEMLIDQVLKYVYTGQVDQIDRMSKELLKLAITYKLNELKDMCEDALCIDLNDDNCVEYFIFADKYNAHKLRRIAKNFIRNNRRKIVYTTSFKELSDKSLLNEIVQYMVAEDE